MKNIHTSSNKRTILVSKYFYCLQRLEKYMTYLNPINLKMYFDLKNPTLRVYSEGINQYI